jgi:diguanylate cyclase (GGDEF)-like protein
LAEEVWVADLKGKIVASSISDQKGASLPLNEIQWVTYVQKTYSPRTWFHAQVESNWVTFYAPIVLDDVPQYVAVLRYSLGNMKQAIRDVGKLCLMVVAGIVAVMIPFCLLFVQSILGPIRVLNEATQDIAAGNLTQKVEIPTQDELGELAETFNEMTAALVAMKARAENANPLTKLPGNNVIHEEIEKRIQAKKKFVAIYSDLDNFKAFNDCYGIGAGDQAIKLTAQIMREALRKGDPSDFLGHEGGDDFILLTTPEKAQEVANHICSEFDRRIRQLYSPEDQKRGYIVSKDREGQIRQFPLMTISLAGVTNAHRELASYAEVTNICAEVKKWAKMQSKKEGRSCFVVDRRSADAGKTHPEGSFDLTEKEGSA